MAFAIGYSAPVNLDTQAIIDNLLYRLNKDALVEQYRHSHIPPVPKDKEAEAQILGLGGKPSVTFEPLFSRLTQDARIQLLPKEEEMMQHDPSGPGSFESTFDAHTPPPSTRLNQVYSVLVRQKPRFQEAGAGRNADEELEAKMQSFLRDIAPFILNKIRG